MNSLIEKINLTLIIQKGVKAAGIVISCNENTPYIFGDKKIRKEGEIVSSRRKCM